MNNVLRKAIRQLANLIVCHSTEEKVVADNAAIIRAIDRGVIYDTETLIEMLNLVTSDFENHL